MSLWSLHSIKNDTTGGNLSVKKIMIDYKLFDFFFCQPN